MGSRSTCRRISKVETKGWLLYTHPLEKAVKYSQMNTTATIPGQFEPGIAPPMPTPVETPKKATAMTAAPIIKSGRLPTLSTNVMEMVVVKK
jgi:hypothetical protein